MTNNQFKLLLYVFLTTFVGLSALLSVGVAINGGISPPWPDSSTWAKAFWNMLVSLIQSYIFAYFFVRAFLTAKEL